MVLNSAKQRATSNIAKAPIIHANILYVPEASAAWNDPKSQPDPTIPPTEANNIAERPISFFNFSFMSIKFSYPKWMRKSNNF